MSKGFRVAPQPNKKEAQQQVATELANLQMAGRVSQMMVGQLLESVKGMKQDLGAVLQKNMELEYRLGALSKKLALDPKELEAIANDQRLVDFNEATVNADQRENLVVGEAVSSDSTITITSTATNDKGLDQGIFRSRLKLSESGVPDLIAQLQGKKVGDKVVTKLNGLDHEVEVLSIRNPSPQVEASPEVLQ